MSIKTIMKTNSGKGIDYSVYGQTKRRVNFKELRKLMEKQYTFPVNLHTFQPAWFYFLSCGHRDCGLLNFKLILSNEKKSNDRFEDYSQQEPF